MTSKILLADSLLFIMASGCLVRPKSRILNLPLAWGLLQIGVVLGLAALWERH